MEIWDSEGVSSHPDKTLAAKQEWERSWLTMGHALAWIGMSRNRLGEKDAQQLFACGRSLSRKSRSRIGGFLCKLTSDRRLRSR